ncbi:MAG: right-handed parallel beta-helix repeat-containing protein [Sandaracinaceae bacterium]|nr:right-handed parallel beta-helix repeat-containing protein [Sandaracinaceae bacterium]
MRTSLAVLLSLSVVVGCTNTLMGTNMPGADGSIDAGPLPDGTIPRRDSAADADVDMATHVPGANDPPVAHDDFYFTNVGVAVALGNVLTNDTDADGNTLSVSMNGTPAHGSVTVTGSGMFNYVPTASYFGEDFFTYEVADGQGGTATGTIYVYVSRTTYYVSPSGNDSNAGTSPATAWQTVERVRTANNANIFQPGDALLFERGNRFRTVATLTLRAAGTAGAPFVVGAYGTGEQPILSGSRAVTGFTPYMGNIWQATVTGPVEHVYINDAHQTLARYPNTGFLRVESGTLTTLNDPDLTQPNGYFDGASLRIRSINWLYDVRPIATYTTGNLAWTEALSNNLGSDDWGYFLDNKLNLLDVEGEWFYDESTSKLYVFAPGGGDPNSMNVEATQYVDNGTGIADEGIALTGAHQRMVNMTIERFTAVALDIHYNTEDVAVRGCKLRESYMGIRSYTNSLTVEDNEVYDTYATGIQIGGNDLMVARNYVHDIAMLPGFGEQRWGYFGIRISGNNNTIRRNIVEDIGYIGITFGGSHPSAGVFNLDTGMVVEENVVRRACAVLNDGGAIAFDNSDGLIIRRNLVFDTVGNLDSQKTRAGWILNHRFAPGIYFGNQQLQNVTVESNVSAGNSNGIHMDHTTRNHGNVLRNNLLFGNDTAQITMSDASNDQEPPPAGPCVMNPGDTVTGNTMFGLAATQNVLQTLEYRCPAAVNWGTFNGNRYFTITRTDVVQRERSMGATTDHFTLPQWQAASGQDADATTFTLPWTGGVGHEAEFHENPYPSGRVVAFTGTRLTLDGATVSSPQVVPPYSVLILLP